MMKKCKGGMLILVVLIVSVISIMFVPSYLVSVYTERAEDIQDSLHLANISVYSQMDIKRAGNIDKVYVITNKKKAYDTFLKYLKINMNLNDNLDFKNNGLIKGKVNVKEFIIYNVENNIVDVCTFNSYGSYTEEKKEKKDVKTPNGTSVINTTVSTTISFHVEGVLGKISEREISVDTDLVKEGGNNER